MSRTRSQVLSLSVAAVRFADEVGGDAVHAARIGARVGGHRHDLGVLAEDAVLLAQVDQVVLEFVGDEEAAGRR